MESGKALGTAAEKATVHRRNRLMNKNSLKALVGAALLTLSLSACGGNGGANDSAEPDETGDAQYAVEDFQTGEATVHEEILPLEFDEGEVIDNLYYKRTTNDDGIPCYAVMKSSGQMAYLPMDETTCYVTESGSSYYEAIPITYTMNGEEVSKTQYQLFTRLDSVEDNAQDQTA